MKENDLSTFSNFGLSAELIRGIKEKGFEHPTPIQSEVIPFLLHTKKDFIGMAHTGTGKTAAFGLPLIERTDPLSFDVQVLILVPTRELCRQIAEELEDFGKYIEYLEILAVYGGASISQQIKSLKEPQHILVSTTGRLIDLLKRKSVHLDGLQTIVLDEADEILAMGFRDELDEIMRYVPRDKMTWLFSATFDKKVQGVVEAYMNDPVRIEVSDHPVMTNQIQHLYAELRSGQKKEFLIRILKDLRELRGIIFCRTRKETRWLTRELQRAGCTVDCIHGDMSQGIRNKVMNRFRSGRLSLLVATDIAARGLDVDELTHIFHYQLPDNPTSYVHRCGRTARGGRTGKSIALVTRRDLPILRDFGDELNIGWSKYKQGSL